MDKKPEDPKKKTACDAENAYADDLPEPQEHNKDVISYRRPRPGETFLGGRGVILGSPFFSSRTSARKSKEEEEFKHRALKAFDKVLKEEAEAQFNESPSEELLKRDRKGDMPRDEGQSERESI